MKVMHPILYLCTLPVIFFACAKDSVDAPVIAVIPDPIPLEVDVSENESLLNLHAVAPPQNERAKYVVDARLILEAQAFESQEKFADARARWIMAAQIPASPFSAEIFAGWVKSEARFIEKPMTIADWNTHLLKKCQEQKSCAILEQIKAVRGDLYTRRLLEMIPDKILDAALLHTRLIDGDGQLAEFLSAKDWLVRLRNGAVISRICDLKETEHAPLIERARQEFDGELLATLFSAQDHACQGKTAEAIKDYEKTLKKLNREKTLVLTQLLILDRLVDLYKSRGDRAKIADCYRDKMDLWELADVAKAFAKIPKDYYQMRINDSLWAARALSLVGRLDQGQVYVETSLQQIDLAQKLPEFQSKGLRQELVGLKAEAYSVLAMRIALERNDLAAAVVYLEKALALNVNTEWNDRILKNMALVHYSRQEHARGLNALNRLSASEENQSASALFWVGLLRQLSGDQKGSQASYDRLLKKEPLHFYALVAPTLASLEWREAWKQKFSDAKGMQEKIATTNPKTAKVFRAIDGVSSLLMKAEILVAAKADTLARTAVKKLSQQIQQRVRLSEKSLEAFVYLTRLQYAAGEYRLAISLSMDLARAVPNFWDRFPEQILIAFPRPFSDVYARFSEEQEINKNILLAVSRQETNFGVDAKSPAGALGIMQLMPHTARRMAIEAGLDPFGIEESLFEAETNIQLGSQYLRNLSRYYKGYLPAIFASYNAGEDAVDNWLARRQYGDVLVWLDSIPFGETRSYVMNVWRNMIVYNELEGFPNTGMVEFSRKLRQELESGPTSH